MQPRSLGIIGVLSIVLTASSAVDAQPFTKAVRVGYLSTSPLPADEGFRQGLRELGYLEGQNLSIEYRWSEGKTDRFPALAADLARLKVDVIVVVGTPAALAAKSATGTIPVVMAAVGDPVATGLVSSLGRPGGNVTGLSVVHAELEGKRVELLKEMLPRLRRMGVLWNPANQASAVGLKLLRTSAEAAGVTLKPFGAREPAELEGALSEIARERPDALNVHVDPVFYAYRGRIVEFAAKNRLPAMYAAREFVDGGGLVSYSPSFVDVFRRAATYVDKILKGARPGDLPVEQPTRFELVVNLKTAKALGLTIPPSVLIRADHVIQ